MNNLSPVIVALALALSSTAYATQKRTPLIVKGELAPVEIDLRVNGVHLGSSQRVVQNRLGNPLRSRDEKELDETCGPAHTVRTLEYDGLTVVMRGTLQKREFSVVSIDVTSSRWLVSNRLRIGMTFARAMSVLGKVDIDTESDGVRTLDYINIGNDGGATLTFRRDRLVKIDWQSALC